jgi:hypothetical protein
MSNEMQKVETSEKLSLEQITAAVPEQYRENVTSLFRLLNPASSDLQFGDIDTSRFTYRPPMIRIRQPMSRTNLPVKNGEFYSPDTGEVLQRPINLIPIFTWENRMRFVDGEKEVCVSEDGERSTSGLICAQCIDRPWKDKQRQECNDYLHFLFVTPNYDKLYKMSFSGTSAKAGRAIISQCMSARQNLWTRIYTIGSDEQKGGKGPYWSATATFVEASPKETHFAGSKLNEALKESRINMKVELSKKLAENKAVIDQALSSGKATSQADFSNL